MRYSWVIASTVGFMVLIMATLVHAQTASPTTSPSPTLPSPTLNPTPPAPTNASGTPSPSPTVSLSPLEVAPADLGVPSPSSWQFFKRKFVRFFTRNEVNRAKLNLELANLTLLRAEQFLEHGNQAAATEALQSYQTQISQVNAAVGGLVGQLAQDARVQSLVDRLTQDNLLQVELLAGLEDSPAVAFNERVLEARLEVTKKLADLLTKEDLTPEEFAEKLQKLETKLLEKETDAERKALRRLRLFDDLDEVTDDAELEEGLEDRAKAAVKEAARDLAPDQLGELVRQIPGDQWKHLAVLQAVLDQVPAQARPALERAIAEELADLAEDLRNEREDAFETMLEDAEDEEILEAQEELTKKLQEKLKDDQKRAEKLQKKLQKLQEKLREEAAEEDEEEDARRGAVTPSPSPTTPTRLPTPAATRANEADDEDNDQSTASPSPSPTKATSTLSPTPTPSSTTTDKLELEVDIQNFAFSKVLTLEKGRKTKIRVRNRDSVSHTLTISGLGVSTGTVKPGGDEDIEFTPPTSGSFKVSCDFHPSMSGSAQVN